MFIADIYPGQECIYFNGEDLACPVRVLRVDMLIPNIEASTIVVEALSIGDHAGKRWVAMPHQLQPRPVPA